MPQAVKLLRIFRSVVATERQHKDLLVQFFSRPSIRLSFGEWTPTFESESVMCEWCKSPPTTSDKFRCIALAM